MRVKWPTTCIILTTVVDTSDADLDSIVCTDIATEDTYGDTNDSISRILSMNIEDELLLSLDFLQLMPEFHPS